MGLAEKRILQPPGSSEEKGSPEPPPVWSPMKVTLGKAFIYITKVEHTEFGIEPDIRVSITRKDYQRGVDTILERARALLRKK